MELPLYPLFVLWSVPWVVLTGFALLMLFVVAEGEGWGFGVVVTLLWLGGFVLFGSGGEVEWLTRRNLLWGLMLYMPIGVAYVFLRWTLFVISRRDEFQSIVRGYADKNGFDLVNDKIPADRRVVFTKWFRKAHRANKVGFGAWEHAHRITCWGMWWPFSAIKWVLGDLVWDAWQFVVRRISRVLTTISDRLWGDAADNFDEGESG